MAAQGVGRGGPQPLSVGDALLYLDQVKIEFSDKPEIYNEFLDIMKNFKAQEIDTPGVIQRVSTLFRGYNKLILGFNTFLPEGYKIDLHQLEEMDRQHREREAREAAAAAGQNAGQGARGPAPGQPLPGAGGQGGPPVEFKQAKDYVTTIKKRFANEPHQATYKAFLKILHHYQARPAEEQRNIMDVLEQVSTLFADHPDLLKEFTYFLPDAVQEQAKERLNRAARESELRKAQRQAEQQRQGMGGGNWDRAQMIRGRKEERRGFDKDRYDKRGLDSRDDRKYDQEAMRKQPKGDLRRQKKRTHKSLRTGDLHTPFSYTVANERQFFDHVKETLQSVSRPGHDAWADFLKYLNLYSNDVLNRKDMLNMLEDIFGKHKDLFDEFKMILNARGASDSVQNDLWYSMPLSEIDFSQCRKCTPSYRALPKDYPTPPCTERSPAEEAVLNDTWVSVPVGSEENYSFKHMRRNQYEEALFKCEDERFEIDMVIDSNTATIRVLEPLAEEIQQLVKAKEEQAKAAGEGVMTAPPTAIQYKLDKRTLGIIHLNAITRIYGDHGLEVLELLRKNPAGAIPVILRRLKQKDLEWRKARQDLNKTWKELLERNYHKSLDHRSFYFGQSDKKAIQPKMLVQEIKEKKAEFEGTAAPAELPVANGAAEPGGADKKKAAAAAQPKPKIEKDPALNHFSADLYGHPQILLRYPQAEPSLHKDVYEIVMYAVEHSSASSNDKERIAKLWRDFLKEMLRLPASVFLPKDQEGAAGKDDEGEVSGGAAVAGALPAGEESFIGTHSLYVFFRLHNILYERLKQAREISESAETVSKAAAAHPLKAMRTEESENEDPYLVKHVRDGYQGFKSILEQRLDQTFENSKFEDGCRMLMGNRAYMLFTLDKVVTSIVKQLQHLVDEDVFTTMQKVYKEEKEAHQGRAPTDYKGRVVKNLKDNGHAAEELYRITYIKGPKTIGGQKFDDSLMLLEYLGLADEASANKGIGSLLDEARNMDEEEDDDNEEEPSEEEEEEGGLMEVDQPEPSDAPAATSPRTAGGKGAGGPPTGYFSRKGGDEDKPFGGGDKGADASHKRPFPDGSDDKGMKRVRETEMF